MRYCKQIENGYIVAVGSGNGGVEITATEYQTIIAAIQNKPTPPAGFDYRLKADLAWELYELPPEDPDPELSAEEALAIIMGGDGHETI